MIPDEARATLNVRLLPGESLEAFVRTLEELVDDPAIEFAYDPPGPEPPGAPREGEFFQAL
ncbi:MAG: peptidase dimerization domain-containing protein, partial [Terriglobia bacterium]